LDADRDAVREKERGIAASDFEGDRGWEATT
jgi:hypothetical protein